MFTLVNAGVIKVLALAFFVSVFSTVVWLIYAFLFVSEKLAGIPLNSLSLFDASIYTAFMILPVFVLWAVFGYINQYLQTRNLSSNMLSLFKQMKKNMDYTDLVARIMLEAEQEIKDGFILNKFDIFIADMNELLAEIIRRTGIASSEQIENLWIKVQNGGKWSFGRVLIEVCQNQNDFQNRVFNRSKQDVVLSGSLLEFVARYQALIALLEKHDKEHVFLNLIETGVFGKVYSIMAPVADEVQRNRDATETTQKTSSLAAFASFQNEDKFAEPQQGADLFAEKNSDTSAKTSSLLAKFNLFKKKDNANVSDEDDADDGSKDDDPFTKALERSFGADSSSTAEEKKEPKFEVIETQKEKVESWHDDKQFDIEDFTGHVNNIETPKAKDFLETNKTLKSLRKEWEKMKANEAKTVEASHKKAVNEDSLVYPFSSWVDEVGSKK